MPFSIPALATQCLASNVFRGQDSDGAGLLELVLLQVPRCGQDEGVMVLLRTGPFFWSINKSSTATTKFIGRGFLCVVRMIHFTLLLYTGTLAVEDHDQLTHATLPPAMDWSVVESPSFKASIMDCNLRLSKGS